MFHLRRFKNSDPPALAGIWNSQPPQRGLVQPVSSALLEQCLLGKQVFDPEGLRIAESEGRVVGFSHGSFGPNEQNNGLDYSVGCTQMVMMHTDWQSPELSHELLLSSEEYLRSRGARVLYGGGIEPLNAFYLGLYGGSELSGVLGTDPTFSWVFQENDYEPSVRSIVLHLELARMRPVVSREQRMLKRETVLDQNYCPAPGNWWEANRLGEIDRQRFRLMPRRGAEPLASVEFWDIEPLASSWGIRTSGMRSLFVHNDHRRKKLASYLLSEAFKLLRKRGVSVVEAHVMAENEAALNLYRGLGFTQVDTATVYRKPG